MRSSLICGACLLLAVTIAQPGLVQAAPWKVDRSHSFVHFEVWHLGIFPFPGRFKKHRIELDYRPDDVEQSQVDVRIPVRSLETDDGVMNDILVSDQFFDANNFPEMRFVSTGIRRTGENTAVIDGELTIIGITRPVSLDAKFHGKAKHPFTGAPIVGIEAVTTIDRRKWSLGAWRGFVGTDVRIRIAFEASPK